MFHHQLPPDRINYIALVLPIGLKRSTMCGTRNTRWSFTRRAQKVSSRWTWAPVILWLHFTPRERNSRTNLVKKGMIYNSKTKTIWELRRRKMAMASKRMAKKKLAVQERRMTTRSRRACPPSRQSTCRSSLLPTSEVRPFMIEAWTLPIQRSPSSSTSITLSNGMQA